MLCLMSAPSKLDKTKFPGAHSRFEDFVVVHMNQTLKIHGTVPTPKFLIPQLSRRWD
jgi:tyrosinase